MEADETKGEMRGKIGEEEVGGGWHRCNGDAGDDNAAYAAAVIGSHHRAAIFTASPPGSIQTVCAPVTSHQVGRGRATSEGKDNTN